METVTLIISLEATTVNNTSNSSGVTEGEIAGATAGVTPGELIEYDRATDSATITQF